MLRSFFSITVLVFFSTSLTGCATVPLPGRGFTTPQPVRPVKPLMEGREGAISQKSPPPNPSAKPGTKPGVKPSASAQSKQAISESAVASKLQEAEDKAASARSLIQSAQTEDDWNLVAQQWKRALALLPNPAATSVLSGKVQQVRNTYTNGLQLAQAQAQSSGKPTATAPIEIDRNSSGRRGMILGTEASPSPSAAPTDKSTNKPGDKPTDKPTEPPKNNPTPTPSVKN